MMSDRFARPDVAQIPVYQARWTLVYLRSLDDPEVDPLIRIYDGIVAFADKHGLSTVTLTSDRDGDQCIFTASDPSED